MSYWQYSDHIRLTKHAKKRMANRRVTPNDIAFALCFGQKIHRQGQVFFTVRAKDIRDSQRNSAKHLNGLTIVMCGSQPEIITVYKDKKNALSKLKRKRKYQKH